MIVYEKKEMGPFQRERLAKERRSKFYISEEDRAQRQAMSDAFDAAREKSAAEHLALADAPTLECLKLLVPLGRETANRLLDLIPRMHLHNFGIRLEEELRKAEAEEPRKQKRPTT